MYVRKLTVAVALALTALLGAVPALWAAPLVKEARIGQNGNTLRVVLEADEPLNPLAVFALDNPDRLVLDFPVLEFKTNLNKLSIPDDNPLLVGIRASRYSDTKSRIVLDLKRPVEVSRFAIPPKEGSEYRYVLDLSPASGKAISAVQAQQSPKDEESVPSSVFDAPEPKKTVVIIDPGHGGVDPGAIGKYKTREKDVVLQVAKRLKAQLDKTPGYEAHLTRNSDVFVRLGDRVRKAQNHSGDIFISLHADSHNDRRVSGGSVYVLSEKSSDKEAERLARIANEGDLFAGIDISNEPKEVQNILIDLTQRETLNESARLARQIVLNMEKGDIDLKSRRTKFAGFRVLKAPEIPSILIEMAYISNPRDERNLKDKDYQERLAKSIAKGVQSFVELHTANNN